MAAGVEWSARARLATDRAALRCAALLVRLRVLSRCSDFTFTSIGPSLPTAFLRLEQSLSLSLSPILSIPSAVLVCSPPPCRTCPRRQLRRSTATQLFPLAQDSASTQAAACHLHHQYCYLSRNYGPHPNHTTLREPPTATRGLLSFFKPSRLRNSTSQPRDSAGRTLVTNCCGHHTTPA